MGLSQQDKKCDISAAGETTLNPEPDNLSLYDFLRFVLEVFLYYKLLS
jgi:hypothetical protein